MELYVISGVNAMLRKVAGAAASKPHVEIKQDGEHFYIKTSTTVRTTEISFNIGEEFNEETVDGRKCKVTMINLHLKHLLALLTSKNKDMENIKRYEFSCITSLFSTTILSAPCKLICCT